MIEFTEREIEILGQSYVLLKQLLGGDLDQFDRLFMEHGLELASIKFPRGRNIRDMLEVLHTFKNIYEYHDEKEPF